MGFFSKLFGGGKTKVERDPFGALTPQQKDVSIALGKQLRSQVGQPAEKFQGQLTAPITPGELAVVDQNARLSALGTDTISQAIEQFSPQNINTFFDENVRRPAVEAFKNETLPILTEELPTFSESRGRFISRGLAGLEADLSQQRLDALLRSPEIIRNLLATGTDVQRVSQAIQAVPREIVQAGLGREYAEFVRQKSQEQTSIDNMLRFLGISQGTAFVRKKPSTFEELLAIANTGANIKSALNIGKLGNQNQSGGNNGGSNKKSKTQTGLDIAKTVATILATLA